MHPRDELVTTMDRIYRRGLTTTSGGNLSIRDTDDSIWITPAGIDKGTTGGVWPVVSGQHRIDLSPQSLRGSIASPRC